MGVSIKKESFQALGLLVRSFRLRKPLLGYTFLMFTKCQIILLKTFSYEIKSFMITLYVGSKASITSLMRDLKP
jgi:hypothetical protein